MKEMDFYLSVVGGMLVVMLMNLMMVMMRGIRIVMMVLGIIGPNIHLSSTGSLRRS